MYDHMYVQVCYGTQKRGRGWVHKVHVHNAHTSLSLSHTHTHTHIHTPLAIKEDGHYRIGYPQLMHSS